ncbi:PP2C family protein-serine/threonine phosphatase [Geobacter grbiciae]|uniref:PP2C family protein-serine/threonine phosphatase n=1 Tax=Geobacter grbiciae TaxID=155042 RepID=UPI001C03942F|nr:PP2C family protein-serine/threonine phosphatase [Geobacter grbiciae]MBT1073929.1 SpoIIE family protein phosphatase [Geobacter grbiciae]
MAARNRGRNGQRIDPSELELAREVERLLFPKSSPVCTWNCIGVKNRTAGVLGGDYFDSVTLPDSRLAVVIGDVTGHGLHASVVMSMLYGFIHHAAFDQIEPQELAKQVNAFLSHFAERSLTFDLYFSTTLFMGIIDPKTLELEYVNAGHVPPLIRRAGAIIELAPTTNPLGYFKSLDISAASVRLEQGDRLLLYTDGIIEAANPSGDRFGLERLKETLTGNVPDHLEFLDRVFAGLRSFGAADPPEDDCTLLVVDIHGPVPP